ncbi:fructosamine kinase family protein [Robertkochia aurantiaca]|uniref:fructosamine kinase family protein n=1 Tax=Robertkochia aurantiaca TaxID=2873700 RepID=UPI001CCBDE91|nr:fructosamine kinase family protein [Robertkochia sp. 3YJGBD-33]
MQKQLIGIIQKALDTEIRGYKPLSGGDINQVYLLSLPHDRSAVVKLNDASRFPGMFKAEAKGLKEIRRTNSFRVPDVLTEGKINQQSYLVLEYISEGGKKDDFWEEFAFKLQKMHRKSSDQFGLTTDNYIGSLPQSNTRHQKASSFYISERIEPQVKMAHDRGFSLRLNESFYVRLEKLIPDEKPSLVHGDLWGGNHMTDETGSPCLIDPAVSYAPREMDLAMMQLFGGFSSQVYQHYEALFPPEGNWRERTDIWQLYYLLVHLNLFGASYLGSVNSIIAKYS